MDYAIWWNIVAALAAYAVLAAALDRPAHNTIYPLVGWGHPLTGRRRWLVRVFGPFVLLGIGLYHLPIVLVLVLIAAGR